MPSTVSAPVAPAGSAPASSPAVSPLSSPSARKPPAERTAFVVGAGMVGLACAAALARRGLAPIVLEAGPAIGQGVSSRNSEVIHAGLYYEPGSLKARHCVDGRRRLVAYCEARGLPLRVCGKLVVATEDGEIPKIEAIAARGRANGVEGLEMLDGAAARAMEPALRCVAALHSPVTGIFDSHAVMLSLLGEVEDAGGAVALRTGVKTVRQGAGGGFEIEVEDAGGAADTVEADILVNAAGLGATGLAGRMDFHPPALVPRLTLAKGHYFGFAGRAAFSRLIYPAPADGGLGVHVTLDLSGRMRFGPDVEWIDSESAGYAADPARAEAFYDSIRRYWPALPDGSLVPDYAGIRPKLSGPGEPAADFRIDGPETHGLAGLVQLYGIESPGLTSALSIAEDVADRALG